MKWTNFVYLKLKNQNKIKNFKLGPLFQKYSGTHAKIHYVILCEIMIFFTITSFYINFLKSLLKKFSVTLFEFKFDNINNKNNFFFSVRKRFKLK